MNVNKINLFQNESDCDGAFAIRPQAGLSTKQYIGDFYILKPLNYEIATVWQITLQAFVSMKVLHSGI